MALLETQRMNAASRQQSARRARLVVAEELHAKLFGGYGTGIPSPGISLAERIR